MRLQDMPTHHTRPHTRDAALHTLRMISDALYIDTRYSDTCSDEARAHVQRVIDDWAVYAADCIARGLYDYAPIWTYVIDELRAHTCRGPRKYALYIAALELNVYSHDAYVQIAAARAYVDAVRNYLSA